jgi:hypothetical protein
MFHIRLKKYDCENTSFYDNNRPVIIAHIQTLHEQAIQASKVKV